MMPDRIECNCDQKHRVNLPDWVEEKFVNYNLRTTRIRQTKCRLCGDIWNNKIDMDAARSNKSNGNYGVSYAE